MIAYVITLLFTCCVSVIDGPLARRALSADVGPSVVRRPSVVRPSYISKNRQERPIVIRNSKRKLTPIMMLLRSDPVQTLPPLERDDRPLSGESTIDPSPSDNNIDLLSAQQTIGLGRRGECASFIKRLTLR